MIYLFGIIERSTSRIMGTYTGDRIRMTGNYADQTLYLHFEVVNEYVEAYYIDAQGSLAYDLYYTPPVPTYEKAKEAQLTAIQENFKELSTAFAVENSEILNTEILRLAGLGQINPADPVAVATFVRSKLDPLVDALKPLHEDIKMHYFWRVEHYIALVPREDLLASEARLSQYQTDLIAVVRP